MKIYHDQVIEAAYLHSRPGCFYIGPFARRVSFSSQQHRALDLIAALQEKRKLSSSRGKKSKTVAVIGAGVAGLTVASALRGQNCKVHLYEREEQPLLLQQSAAHRLIHPTISRWPAGELELTTRFAFLDWFAAPSDRVIASLRADWDQRLAPKDGDDTFKFWNLVTVLDVICDDGKVRLVLDTEREDVPLDEYDYVFVTTGYAEEDSFGKERATPYWEDDEVDAWRKNKNEVFISGCGDGGLIDTLRLVHGDFDRGWLTIRVAEALGKKFERRILDAEDEALMASKSLLCMELAKGESNDKTGDSDRKLGSRFEDRDIVTKLTRFYRDLVQELPPVAVKLMRDSLDLASVQTGRVTLVSRQVEPFGAYAAPIHKIMTQFAIKAGAVIFKQGELVARPNRSDPKKERIFIKWAGGQSPTEITGDRRLIIRHGSPANLKKLAEGPESSSLRIRQFMLADYIDLELERSLAAPKGYPNKLQPSELHEYIGIRRPMAESLMDAIVPGASVTAKKDRFEYEVPAIAPIGAKSVRVAIPSDMFGVQLEEAPMIDVSPL